MNQSKLILNLNEQNELAFKISIEGSNSEVGSEKPNIRFLVREGSGEVSWVYPTYQDEDGDVIVNINKTEMFSEDIEYHGKLEVILGNHYFVPAEVQLEFIKPLKVEAVVVASKKTLREKKEGTNTSVSAGPVQLRNKKPALKRRTKKAKRMWEDLSLKEQSELLDLHKQKKLKALQNEKEKMQLAESKIKSNLKKMMFDSLTDED